MLIDWIVRDDRIGSVRHCSLDKIRISPVYQLKSSLNLGRVKPANGRFMPKLIYLAALPAAIELSLQTRSLADFELLDHPFLLNISLLRRLQVA